ncbi:unknown protein [Parachlamydia acanthamoebae UV-7]|uniref:Uncharacterized protein n=1 Tax=Parachlamydia acanthamoebae (strain UV7) TaxID=765952 RepID=F8L2E2_PARAV|nr:unknown protein [Parachlamydia acanthamoebae UV-7]
MIVKKRSPLFQLVISKEQATLAVAKFRRASPPNLSKFTFRRRFGKRFHLDLDAQKVVKFFSQLYDLKIVFRDAFL